MRRVLIIDDDKVCLSALAGHLENDYEVTTATDSEEGLLLANSTNPDILLLDVEMPGLDGYEVCQRIRSNESSRYTPIIFLSRHQSLEDKMRGYQAGASDFLVKPAQPEEVSLKIGILLRQKDDTTRLYDEARTATATALATMAGNSELGQAIQFVENSYIAASYDDLARRFLSVMSGIGLNCCLYFHSQEGPMFYGNQGQVSPLEQDLMAMLHNQAQRFKDFGCRTQVNYPRVSLLIKNMPVEDPDKYGRFKDLFPSLMGATDAKIKALDTEKALIRQSTDLATSFGNVKDTLLNLAMSFDQNQQQTMKTMQTMLTELDFRLPSMGLEEDQEAYLIGRIDQAVQEAAVLINQSENLHAAFHNISRLLEHLANQQRRITQSVLTPVAEEAETASETYTDSSVELF